NLSLSTSYYIFYFHFLFVAIFLETKILFFFHRAQRSFFLSSLSTDLSSSKKIGFQSLKYRHNCEPVPKVANTEKENKIVRFFTVLIGRRMIAVISGGSQNINRITEDWLVK
ncbi:hypothetical protein LINGRAHAP2_LOCUS32407, partial [Linum grandiflorum]